MGVGEFYNQRYNLHGVVNLGRGIDWRGRNNNRDPKEQRPPRRPMCPSTTNLRRK
jgi:hypothetical protein